MNKDDLRRLMKEKSKSTTTDGKRIDSPLAKYPFVCHFIDRVCLQLDIPNYRPTTFSSDTGVWKEI